MDDIPEGKFKIICSDGRAHNAEIRTPSGDLIYASRVTIEMKPGNLCTAVITVTDIPVDVRICSDNVILIKEATKATEIGS